MKNNLLLIGIFLLCLTSQAQIKSIATFEKYIIKGEKPLIQGVETKYDQSGIRFIVWDVPKIKSYEYSNQEFDKLGYELIKSDYKNKVSYRNCAKNIMVDVGELEGKLSITMTWISASMKNQTKLMFCKSEMSEEEDFKEAQKIWRKEAEAKRIKDSIAAGTPFTIVEEMPDFPGGDAQMDKYIIENIKIPQKAKDGGLASVKCYVTFIVEKDGQLKDIKILRGIPGCEECDIEALRIVNSMPTWKPGKQNGNAVRVQYNLPIKFK